MKGPNSVDGTHFVRLFPFFLASPREGLVLSEPVATLCLQCSYKSLEFLLLKGRLLFGEP